MLRLCSRRCPAVGLYGGVHGIHSMHWDRRPFRYRTTSASTEQNLHPPKTFPDERTGDVPSQVVGQVMSAEANFVRVRVLDADVSVSQPPIDIQMTNRNGRPLSTDPLYTQNDLLCVVRSVLKKMEHRVLVGDFVRVSSIDWADARGVVAEVLHRHSELADPPVANINHLLVLLSISNPPFDALQATRFLVEAESAGVPVSLAINKIDLESADRMDALTQRLSKWGYDAHMISCTTAEGVRSLDDMLKGKISAVIGPSGVGKSSLINAMRRDARMTQQTVKEVSSIGRGKHTTRTIAFLELPFGGFLADTPGFNVPDLSGVVSPSLQDLFPEISKMKTRRPCRFANCQHLLEPDCSLNDIDWERYPIYARLHEEIQERETYERRVLQLSKKKRQGRVKRKSGRGGQIKEEALLESKKHRRVSRRTSTQELQSLLDENAAENEQHLF